MFKLFKIALFLVLALASLFLFAGCSTTTPTQADSITAAALAKPVIKYVVIKPGADLLKNCEIDSQPPGTKAYLAMTQVDKEIALAEYARALQGELARCAAKPPLLREFFDEQQRVYQGP